MILLGGCVTAGNPGLQRDVPEDCEKLLKMHRVPQPNGGDNAFLVIKTAQRTIRVMNKEVLEFKKCSARVRARFATGK